MIYIILPAYNEESTLPPLLNAIKENMEESRLSYKVIVVNDGSTDNTPHVVRELSPLMHLRLVNQPENKGLAESLKTGLLEAIKEAQAKDIIITMDSDNTHTPGLIMRMVSMIREGHDVVIASRYKSGSRVIGVPLFRRMLSFGASILLRILFPMKGVKDYTSGYRAYKAEVIKRMFSVYGQNIIDQPGFSCMVDLLLKMRRYHLIIAEVPLLLRYDQKTSISKMNVAKTMVETLKLIIKRRFLSS